MGPGQLNSTFFEACALLSRERCLVSSDRLHTPGGRLVAI